MSLRARRSALTHDTPASASRRRARIPRDDRPKRLIAETTMQNRSIPSATIIPELGYADVPAAAAWLCDALGFRERLRIANHRIQLTLGDGALVVIEGPGTPDPSHASAHVVMLRVEDIDTLFARALARGAEALRPPADYPYGERQCTLRDPGGHVWTLSQSIADVDPADWGGELLARS
jgi:uncharacterized glyoxalase superfamily protein PhnB